MIVVSMTKCPPKLRGDISKWLLEINTGVYVGHVSARVRDALWKRICDNIKDGQATMVFTANNEQHMDFYVHNTSWKPVDFDGIKLMKRPLSIENCITNLELKNGFSNAAKQRMVKKRRKFAVETSYVLLDIETTGLSYESDEIIEIGAVEVVNGSMISQNSWLIRPEKPIPDDINKLTGINEQLISHEGLALKEVLTELFNIIKNKTVLFYNAGFDMKFLEKSAEQCEIEFPDININDVLLIARNSLKDIDNYKLEFVAYNLGINCKQKHRALDDCILLNKVYNKLNEI